MQIKDILIYLAHNDTNIQTINSAKRIAEQHDAHITGIYVTPSLHVPSYSGIHHTMPAVVIEQVEKSIQVSKQECSDTFKRLMEGFAGTSDWIERHGDPVEAVSNASFNYDLVIASQIGPETNNPLLQENLEKMTLCAGRPVLTLPYQFSQSEIGKNIVVAWNGKREATRAVHDAMPFLTNASAVSILQINPDKGIDIPCEDIAKHLSRHGINAEVNSAYAYNKDVGAHILEMATNAQADLLVMGAYGHSRFRELIMGGVTRFMRQNTTLPILMSH